MSGTSTRLLALLSLLQAPRDWPATVLSERLDVSERTVRRDVERLRGLGYGVRSVMGPDGGYRLEAGTDLPPLLFDDEQAVALAIALRTAATTTGAGIEDGAARALSTMRQTMPSRLRRRIDALEVTAIRPAPERPSPVTDPDVLSALSVAIRSRDEVRFDYVVPPSSAGDPGAGPARRRAQPHHLVLSGGRWYLVAWDVEREDWRTFRADRIALSVATGPTFERRQVPGGDVATFVLGRFRGNASGGEWPCRGQVILGLAASAVQPYADDGVIEVVDDERCRVTLGSWSWVALAAAFAVFDAEIDVVGPDDLRVAFARLAHRCGAASTPS